MKRNDSETEKCSLPAASWLGHSYKLPPIMQLYTKPNIHQLSSRTDCSSSGVCHHLSDHLSHHIVTRGEMTPSEDWGQLPRSQARCHQLPRAA